MGWTGTQAINRNGSEILEAWRIGWSFSRPNPACSTVLTPSVGAGAVNMPAGKAERIGVKCRYWLKGGFTLIFLDSCCSATFLCHLSKLAVSLWDSKLCVSFGLCWKKTQHHPLPALFEDQQLYTSSSLKGWVFPVCCYWLFQFIKYKYNSQGTPVRLTYKIMWSITC